VQARPARYLASTASGNSRRYHGVVIGAQVRSTARCKPIVEVRLGRGETGGPPGETRNAGPGAQSEGPKERQNGVIKVDSSLRGKVR
jgi:hypothetical protein